MLSRLAIAFLPRARVFDLTEWCKRILTYRLIDIPDVIVVTLGRIIALVALGFVFNYLIYIYSHQQLCAVERAPQRHA